MSFWGLVLEPNKTYTQREVEQAFHISAASLDIHNCDPTEDAVSVVCRKQDSNFILCNLSKKHKIFNVSLNLDFEFGSEISFHVIGNSSVHLTGCLIEDSESFEESDDSLGEEEESGLSKAALLKETKKLLSASAKRKQEDSPSNKSKKAKVQSVGEEDDDDDDEDDSDFDMASSGDEEVEEEEEDDDDDDDEDDEDDDEDAAEILKKLESLKKEKPKQSKANNQSAKQPAKESPKANQNAKQNKKDQGKVQAPTKAVNGAQAQANGIQKKTIKGGVVVEDLAIGSGPVAKEGTMVSVYYVGRLKNNNKQFDASQSGPGFKFRLGREEVIKGWDVGVVGMKVGGKRRLTIPPKMAYGQQGAGSDIPPNSTLVFEVELKNVK